MAANRALKFSMALARFWKRMGLSLVWFIIASKICRRILSSNLAALICAMVPVLKIRLFCFLGGTTNHLMYSWYSVSVSDMRLRAIVREPGFELLGTSLLAPGVGPPEKNARDLFP